MRLRFRVAAPASRARHLVATMVQAFVLWSVFLGVVPWLLVLLERHVGVPGFTFDGQRIVGTLVFVVCGSLGLWSGFAMAWFGEGTPFPTDTARRLVVRGPYAVVRNPMAITGLGQGFAMGIAWGSWSMLAVTFAGGLLWQVFVRPREEADLEQRLGDEYRRYRAAIDCWVPSRRVYDRT